MPRGHVGIPARETVTLSKSSILAELQAVDRDPEATARVLAMEIDFRFRVDTFLDGLPLVSARFERFKTSPYVLLLHSALNNYTRVSQIEHDILPAKLFSSMETSAGKMIEQVTFPIYGWSSVPSRMHTPYSAIDGKRLAGPTLHVATLKSGPACLNDEMAENFADAILSYAPTWAAEHGVSTVDFSYGVLYGTKLGSNKKDWHILRNLLDKVGPLAFSESPLGSWTATFVHDGVTITATVRIGIDWWNFLGSSAGIQTAAVEVWLALIRASIAAGAPDSASHAYLISDLGDIISGVPTDFNVSLLQSGQLPWLFLVARHFADELVP